MGINCASQKAMMLLAPPRDLLTLKDQVSALPGLPSG
jgi:hypothetical protein